MKYLITIFAGVVIFYSCSPQLAEVIVSEEMPVEELVGLNNPQIAAGKVIWENDCTVCHYEQKIITNYTKDQWRGILPGMIVNAKLNVERESQIRSYINWVLNNQ